MKERRGRAGKKQRKGEMDRGREGRRERRKKEGGGNEEERGIDR